MGHEIVQLGVYPQLTKTRFRVTSLGCVVHSVSVFNEKTRCVDESIVLSHPASLHDVAFSSERVLDREAGLR